ncbi:chitinase 1 [Fusarium heterosporum]|uniref:chitinase n=1 Tax=Fusarium heterosporum TaxID=42747 RepID=A0A8H5SKF6_FUSHE|nr:chitinase 1 [Fusarium heterosporum]
MKVIVSTLGCLMLINWTNILPPSSNLCYALWCYLWLIIWYCPLAWLEDHENAYGCVKQLYLLKLKNRKPKTLLSIGGWTWSTKFPSVARSASSRSTSAKSAVTLMKDWGFDGVDVDWEYPSNADDADHMVLLLQAVRDELDAYAAEYAPGYHFQLSLAAPAGLELISLLRISTPSKISDHFNVMTYDFVSTDIASHNANVYATRNIIDATPFNTDDVVRAYLTAGAPGTKIVVGMPFYGRSFTGTSGLGKPSFDVGLANTSLGSWERGVWEYKVLPKTGASISYDDKASA